MPCVVCFVSIASLCLFLCSFHGFLHFVRVPSSYCTSWHPILRTLRLTMTMPMFSSSSKTMWAMAGPSGFPFFELKHDEVHVCKHVFFWFPVPQIKHNLRRQFAQICTTEGLLTNKFVSNFRCRCSAAPTPTPAERKTDMRIFPKSWVSEDFVTKPTSRISISRRISLAVSQGHDGKERRNMLSGSKV